MSLIEEALRRAQESRASGKPAHSPAPTDEPRAPLFAADAAPPSLPVPVAMIPGVGLTTVWTGLAMIAGLSVVVALWTYRTALINRPHVVSLPAAMSPRPPATMTPAPADSSTPSSVQVVTASTPQPAAPSFTLNGVVEGVGEPFAIINGSIVHLGERVNGATLVEVRGNRARLRRENSSEELVLVTTH